MEYYTTIGFTILYNWSYPAPPFEGEDQEVSVCRRSSTVSALNSELYWDPETDIVLLEHVNEPRHRYDARSVCNTNNVSILFSFNERLRFIVIPAALWDMVLETRRICAAGLEVVFILADPAPMVAVLGEVWYENAFLRRRLEDFKVRMGEEMTRKLESERGGFGGEGFLESGQRVEVKVVVRIEEVFEEIRARGPIC